MKTQKTHADLMALAKKLSTVPGETGTLARALLLYGSVRQAAEKYTDVVSEFSDDETRVSGFAAAGEYYELLEDRCVAVGLLIPYNANLPTPEGADDA